jgi:hypothetical protein
VRAAAATAATRGASLACGRHAASALCRGRQHCTRASGRRRRAAGLGRGGGGSHAREAWAGRGADRAGFGCWARREATAR